MDKGQLPPNAAQFNRGGKIYSVVSQTIWNPYYAEFNFFFFIIL